MKNAFDLVAQYQKRGKDIFYKAKKTDFTRILKVLQIVENLDEANAKVDRMWELLVELVLFSRSKKHRAPVEILRSFIKASGDGKQHHNPISPAELNGLRRVFRFLIKAYKNKSLYGSRLAQNQIHFYTMITSIISRDLLKQHGESQLIEKLVTFGSLLNENAKPPKNLKKIMDDYLELAAKHTTHPGRRADRESLFSQAIDLL